MMKQTAVEWLISELRTKCVFNFEDVEILEQAKQMGRQQIIDAHIEGQPFYSCQSEKAEKYYKEKYESTGAA